MHSLKQNDISRLDSLIDGLSKAAVVTHVHPDGDAIGSSLGMLSYLESRGKDATVVFPSAIPDTLAFAIPRRLGDKIVIAEENPAAAEAVISSCDVLFCMDFNTPSRTETLATLLESTKMPKVLIDHHLNPERSLFDVCISETEISSASELTFHVLLQMPEIGGKASKLPHECATALFTGMTTDTNNFANSVFPSTLNMASELIAAGVDRDAILDQLYKHYREERFRLMGHLLSEKMKITADGVAYMVMDAATSLKYGIREGETEGFVNIPLGIENVRMSIFLKEQEGRFRVSIRSKNGTSANLCSKRFFNGGGHELAAGGRLDVPAEVANAREAEQYIESATHIFFNEDEA